MEHGTVETCTKSWWQMDGKWNVNGFKLLTQRLGTITEIAKWKHQLQRWLNATVKSQRQNVWQRKQTEIITISLLILVLAIRHHRSVCYIIQTPPPFPPDTTTPPPRPSLSMPSLNITPAKTYRTWTFSYSSTRWHFLANALIYSHYIYSWSFGMHFNPKWLDDVMRNITSNSFYESQQCTKCCNA